MKVNDGIQLTDVLERREYDADAIPDWLRMFLNTELIKIASDEILPDLHEIRWEHPAGTWNMDLIKDSDWLLPSVKNLFNVVSNRLYHATYSE